MFHLLASLHPSAPEQTQNSRGGNKRSARGASKNEGGTHTRTGGAAEAAQAQVRIVHCTQNTNTLFSLCLFCPPFLSLCFLKSSLTLHPLHLSLSYYRMLIVENFVPHKEVEGMSGRAVFDENNGSWSLTPAEFPSTKR